jgi:hypothetical protein
MFGLSEDPRQVELVNGLLEKTRQGKISWSKQGTAITATLPNGIAANFVLAPNLYTWATSWQLFTVRDIQGNELIRVNSSGISVASAMGGGSPLIVATNELFKAVHGFAGDDLDRAIDSLKKL